MKKIAIIGGSYLQKPLIHKARLMGLETHVFSWAKDASNYEEGIFFHPISITEKEAILEKCKELHICGICSIASDLATITVNYVAQEMELVGNSLNCTIKSTNKYAMRKAFLQHGLPSPHAVVVDEYSAQLPFEFPLIVKPTDRSGSRGVNKVYNKYQLVESVKIAVAQSFEQKAIVEEFVVGDEYSIESLSYKGQHYHLAITQKYTTGSPHYIEKGHMEPAVLDKNIENMIIEVTKKGLDALEIKNGASHTELKVDHDENIKLIEIGARMGGDLIGSDLVYLSTGFDFAEAVIKIALGEKPEIRIMNRQTSAIIYIMGKNELVLLDRIKQVSPQILIKYAIFHKNEEVICSSDRLGYFIIASKNRRIIEEQMKQL